MLAVICFAPAFALMLRVPLAPLQLKLLDASNTRLGSLAFGCVARIKSLTQLTISVDKVGVHDLCRLRALALVLVPLPDCFCAVNCAVWCLLALCCVGVCGASNHRCLPFPDPGFDRLVHPLCSRS